MKNIHYIVGPNRRCLCGIYEGEPIGCNQIRGDLNYIKEQLNCQQPYNLKLAFSRIQKVFKSLEEDCE